MQSGTAGTITSKVPVQDSEIEYLMAEWDGDVQQPRSNPFKVTQIRYSGLPDADSIVIILLGDAFTEA